MKYGRLEIRFWKPHPTLGEPDLLLLFSGGPQQPLAVLVEVKLWSGKSGTEEWDQLVRYLRVLDDLDAIGVNVLSNASSAYTYQDGSKSFDWFKLLAVPLYSINSMVDVVAMMDRVRGTEIPPTVSAAPS